MQMNILFREMGALTLTAAACCASAAPKPGKATPDKMNVIYILADDLGYGDLGCTGQRKFTTPNIDRLRAEGILFTNHYSGSTVSAPSRSCLMTGQHTGHTFIRGNAPAAKTLSAREGQYPLPGDTYTLARMFKEAGYATGAFGKWGLGYPGSEGDPLRLGFDRFFGYNCQVEAHRYYPKHLWDNLEKVVLTENLPYNQAVYAPDRIHAEALRFIREHRGTPFFLYLPVILPHAELLAPDDELLAKYKGRFEEVPYPAATPKAPYGPNMGTASYCPQPEPYATFAAMVSRIDKYVGEIVAELKRQGLDKNTIIFFTSDNGPHREGGACPDYFDSYGPFRGIKRDLYEGGIRLPLVAWAPGMIAPNSTSEHICAFWDMLPTFAELAGADISGRTMSDGISIVPTLTGYGKQPRHDYLYWEFYEMGGRIAVRSGKWKGILLDVATPEKRTFELYDLSRDIHEDHNVAERYPHVAARLMRLMREAHIPSELFVFQPGKKR